MIQRSLLVCVAVLIAWHFTAPQLSKKFYTVPGQHRANYLHAQSYVQDAGEEAQVIVGSSMSDRLDERILGSGLIKLTFPGGSPLSGLEIVNRSGRCPPVVWIETNVILRTPEQDLIENALAVWRVELRKVSPVFKEAYRPSEYGIGFLKAVVDKGTKTFAQKAPVGVTSATAICGGLDQRVFEGVMKANREALSKFPSSEILKERVDALAKHVEGLTQRGTRCVFFEMPIEASLQDLAEPAAIREALKLRFPESKYLWLSLLRATPWETSDGIHLTSAEAEEVVQRIKLFEKDLGLDRSIRKVSPHG